MSRKTTSRLVRAVTDRLWTRDRLQMRIADALLSAVAPPRGDQKQTRRRAHAKRTR